MYSSGCDDENENENDNGVQFRLLLVGPNTSEGSCEGQEGARNVVSAAKIIFYFYYFLRIVLFFPMMWNSTHSGALVQVVFTLERVFMRYGRNRGSSVVYYYWIIIPFRRYLFRRAAYDQTVRRKSTCSIVLIYIYIYLFMRKP